MEDNNNNTCGKSPLQFSCVLSNFNCNLFCNLKKKKNTETKKKKQSDFKWKDVEVKQFCVEEITNDAPSPVILSPTITHSRSYIIVILDCVYTRMKKKKTRKENLFYS
jgi:hypothetical protein